MQYFHFVENGNKDNSIVKRIRENFKKLGVSPSSIGLIFDNKGNMIWCEEKELNKFG